jgi:hypothetical protein
MVSTVGAPAAAATVAAASTVGTARVASSADPVSASVATTASGPTAPASHGGMVDAHGNPVTGVAHAAVGVTAAAGGPAGGGPVTAGAGAPGQPGRAAAAAYPVPGGHQNGSAVVRQPVPTAGGVTGVPSQAVHYDTGHSAPTTEAAPAPGSVIDHRQPSGPELPANQVAVLQDVPATAQDAAEWDADGSAFVTLLWPVGGGDREARSTVETPGYTRAEEGTWSDAASAAAPRRAEADDSAEADSGLATWRPDRSPAAPSGTGPGIDGLSLKCGDAEFDPDEVDQDASAEEQAEAEEKTEPRGVADLLVQDESAWGAWPKDPGLPG